MDCVLECMVEDYTHFKAHAAEGSRDGGAGENGKVRRLYYTERTLVILLCHGLDQRSRAPRRLLESFVLLPSFPHPGKKT